MPVYRNRTVLEIARGLKAFFDLGIGFTRCEVPDIAHAQPSDENRQLERMRKQLSSKNRQLKRLQSGSLKARKKANGVRPENVVWIFGFGRSGSTWMSSIMAELKDHVLWHEPLIGALFGNFYYNVSYYGIEVGDALRKNPSFILGSKRKLWLRLIRSFFLDGASERFPKLGDGILVIKEPNGSIGAPLLMEALPESRMVLLARDPRDMMASALDAYNKGSWALDRLGKDGVEEITTEAWVNSYLQHFGNAKQAYENHEGYKVLVKYEDLIEDTLGTIKHVYSTLKLPVDEEELEKVVQKHAWENIPEDQKGQGKFYRRGTSGGWRKDLSTEQVKYVEKAAAPLLKELYP